MKQQPHCQEFLSGVRQRVSNHKAPVFQKQRDAYLVTTSVPLLQLLVVTISVITIPYCHAFRSSPIKISNAKTTKLIPNEPTRLQLQLQGNNIITTKPRSTLSLLSAASSRSSFPATEKLLPEENPDINPTQTSVAGVSYTHVISALHQLYPPEALDERNAASRTDGYWPFIQKGEDPPQQFTYGEFDVVFLAQLLDRVAPSVTTTTTSDNKEQSWNDKVFLDIGSGTGRLVMAAAALHPGWKLCRGIEILPAISNVAEGKLEACREIVQNEDSNNDEDIVTDVTEDEEEEWVENEYGLLVKNAPSEPADNTNGDTNADLEPSEENDAPPTYSMPYGEDIIINKNDDDKDNKESGEQQRLRLAPVEFVCGSFDDPYNYFGDVDCVFCFSSCMSTSILQSLSQAIGRQCRPGTIVITTDFPLLLEGTIPPFPDDPSLPHGDYELELLDPKDGVDGYCWLTGGQSTAYIHRVKRSLWDDTGPRVKPELPASEKAFRAIKAMEEGRDEAAVRFLSGVRNEMFFAGFPEHWLPDPANYQPKRESDQDGIC